MSGMKQKSLPSNLSLLMLGLFCASCTGQVKTTLPTDSLYKPREITDQGLGLPKAPEEMKSFLDAGIDPYFVETKDTVSTRGPQCIVRNLIQDKAGNFWLATWHGIIKYDGQVFTNYTLKYGLIHFHVTTLFEDSKGNIWFGNPRGGVYQYDGKQFTLITTKDGLSDNTVNCIAEDNSGNIWFATEHGVSQYNRKTFTNFTSNDGLSDNFVNAVIKDKTGRLWFGTNNGVNYYNGKSFANFMDQGGLPFQHVASLYEDKSGNIWIGSWAKQAGGKGLCRYDGKSVRNFITPYFVMYLCEDKRGHLWLAHNKAPENINFALYSYNGNAFAKIIEQTKPDNPLIFGIIEDKNGNIWFGTSKGVCCFDGKVFDYFTE